MSRRSITDSLFAAMPTPPIASPCGLSLTHTGLRAEEVVGGFSLRTRPFSTTLRIRRLSVTNSQRLSTVRAALRSWITAQSDEAESEICSEAFLIRDGFFCGRRFNTKSYLGTWFIEQDELKIHSIADGSLCCVMDAEEIDAAAETHPTVLSIQQPIENAAAESAKEDDEQDDFRRAA